MPGNELVAIARRRRTARALRGPLLALALLAGCKTSAGGHHRKHRSDYRQRHPIAIQEGNRTLEVFVGKGAAA
jgi:type IV pilus biogenesis protein CpaD/CtpE